MDITFWGKNKQTETLKLYLNVDDKISWKQILETGNGSCG